MRMWIAAAALVSGMGLAAADAAPMPADMAGMEMPGMDMAGMAMPAPQPAPAPGAVVNLHPVSGTDLPAGHEAAPAPPAGLYGALVYGTSAMQQAHEAMMADNGGRRFSMVLLNIAEMQVADGRPAYRWDGEGWWGSDLDRLVVKSEGRGLLTRERLDDAEADAFYSRAVTRYFDAQIGLRQDLAGPNRTYVAFALEGLAPYWFETEASLFVATDGRVLGRLEGWHDSFLTQRLVLQPRAELDFAARDDRRAGRVSGLSEAELGLRLRYEIRRQFAPYLGASWSWQGGRAGSALQLVTGLRGFF